MGIGEGESETEDSPPTIEGELAVRDASLHKSRSREVGDNGDEEDAARGEAVVAPDGELTIEAPSSSDMRRRRVKR